MERTARILVVDDDIDVRDFVSAMLAQENFDAVSAQDGGEALALLGDGD
jgi:DNA-binding response OmpR family regulator